MMKKLVCALGAVVVSFAALAETAVNGAPELKVYASARGGKTGTDNDAASASVELPVTGTYKMTGLLLMVR